MAPTPRLDRNAPPGRREDGRGSAPVSAARCADYDEYVVVQTVPLRLIAVGER
jgi:hypothetical protein